MKLLAKTFAGSILGIIAFISLGSCSDDQVEPAGNVNTSTTNKSYLIVDTDQSEYYNNQDAISAPAPGTSFYGQDAHFTGNQPSYTNNNDGTISDNVTELMWQQSADQNSNGTIDVDDKLTYSEALARAESFSLAGYEDWRLPTIKELFSLIIFSGLDPSGVQNPTESQLIPFINTDFFDIAYGDTDAGERIIDAQFATKTLYTGTIFMGEEGMFGVNFADGRIKGYPTGPMPGQTEGKLFYVLYVRGNPDYGVNDFTDNGDGTISDKATGLMWSENDNDSDLNWEDALSWVQQMNNADYMGYEDWRLPDIKELQSIVDYSRSPSTTNSASIDPLFSCSGLINEGGSEDFPFYWSGTTHANLVNGSNAAYISFGRALGWMQDPFQNYQLMDVHGAGAQRSDPKTGNATDYPYGHGPQGDVIRINNYVRLVRNIQ